MIRGLAPQRLLDSYDAERTLAADENILNSTRSTDFITPKSSVSRTFRDAVLSLAKHHPFARRLVNSGRLSVPAVLAKSLLNTDDRDADFASGPGAMVPGAPAADAPVEGPSGPWLLGYLGGAFALLAFDAVIDPDDVASLANDRIGCRVVHVGGSIIPGAEQLDDVRGLARRRYDARPGTVYLIRPDQHVCARWRAFDLDRVRAAIALATCNR